MLVPICPVCGGAAEKDRVAFDVIKTIASGSEKRVERFLCGECASRERKREEQLAREKALRLPSRRRCGASNAGALPSQ
jgi:hypothetical protein